MIYKLLFITSFCFVRPCDALASPPQGDTKTEDATPENIAKLPVGSTFFTAGAAVDEVMSQSTSPHTYDWRSASFELDLGYDYADEANNYDSDGWHIGAAMPLDGGFMARALIRRVYVHATHAGELIAKTPFRQAAQPTRYEYGLGGGWALLEGRSLSRLSPLISDLEHVMLVTFGLHYTDPNAGTIPKRGDDTGLLPGQKKVYSSLNWDFGLRWQLYVPRGLGIFFEMQKNLPQRREPDGVDNWQSFSAGVQCAFGGK